MTLCRFHCLHKRLSEPSSFLTWSSPGRSTRCFVIIVFCTSLEIGASATSDEKLHIKIQAGHGRATALLQQLHCSQLKTESCFVKFLKTAGSTGGKNDFQLQLPSVSRQMNSAGAGTHTLRSYRPMGSRRGAHILSDLLFTGVEISTFKCLEESIPIKFQ